MPKEKLLEVLRKHPFVEEFTPEHITRLSELAREVLDPRPPWSQG